MVSGSGPLTSTYAPHPSFSSPSYLSQGWGRVSAPESLGVPEEDMLRLFALKMEGHEGLTWAAI